MKTNLSLDFKKYLPMLRAVQPYIFGVALIGAFGFTAYVVDKAINVEADQTAAGAPDPAAKISFDKKTIESVKKLDVVEGSTPTGDLGKSDPFK